MTITPHELNKLKTKEVILTNDGINYSKRTYKLFNPQKIIIQTLPDHNKISTNTPIQTITHTTHTNNNTHKLTFTDTTQQHTLTLTTNNIDNIQLTLIKK